MYPVYTHSTVTPHKPSRVLGANETTIYRLLVAPGGPKLLTPSTAIDVLKGTTSANSLAHTLSSLEAKGVLRRVGKGVYLNESTGYSPKVVDVIPWIFKPSRYYLGLNAVANHWGLSPQIPHSYHVIYIPRDEAQAKKVTRRCLMLKRVEDDLGGSLTPVVTRTGTVLDKGVSQAIVDGAQLPVSTLERTIIDSMVYTEEIGGASEALLWAKAALNKGINHDEFDRTLDKVYGKVKSIAARLGFLFETALRERLKGEAKAPVNVLLSRLEKLSAKTRATYNWGPENDKTEYFQRWHLHVTVSYLNQLREVSSYE